MHTLVVEAQWHTLVVRTLCQTFHACDKLPGSACERLLGAVLAQGVADYSREHDLWDFTTSPPTMAEAEEVALTSFSLRGWAGQGAIAVINDAAEARVARRLGFPMVCVNGNVRDPGLPRVMSDIMPAARWPLSTSLIAARSDSPILA